MNTVTSEKNNRNRTIYEVSSLFFSYGTKRVLEDINFSVASSETVAILGANGAGKTTLLNCLLGFSRPERGRILLKGRPLDTYSRKELCRLVAYVPQIHRPIFDFTVMEIVLMGRNPHISAMSVPSDNDRQLALSVLETLGIASLADRNYSKISGGELQLALLARALVQASDVLILDEPVAHLDLKNQVRILSLAGSLAREKGYSIIMVLHDPNQALRYADRALLLARGRIIASGRTEDVLTPENILSAYGVDTTSIRYKEETIIIPVIKKLTPADFSENTSQEIEGKETK